MPGLSTEHNDVNFFYKINGEQPSICMGVPSQASRLSHSTLYFTILSAMIVVDTRPAEKVAVIPDQASTSFSITTLPL